MTAEYVKILNKTFSVIATASYWLLAYLWLQLAYEIFFNLNGVPNIQTVPRMRRKMIDILKNDFQARGLPAYTIIDLGSGGGQLAWHIARALPEAHVIGIEGRRTGHYRAVLRQRLFGPRNLEYRRGNFMLEDTARADAVVMYLSRRMAGPVGEKLRKELRPGTLVISNMFALGGDWEPFETINLRALYQTELFLYRQPQSH